MRNLWRQTLGDILHRSAARHPGKTAVVCGEVSWTFAELDRICDRLACGLAERGIVAGDRVAVLSRNSHAFAALRFALARLGAVLVPINFMLNAEEAGFILRHAGVRLLAVGPDLVELGKQAAARETKVERLLWLPGEDFAAAPPGMLTFDALLASQPRPLEAEVDDARSPRSSTPAGPSRCPRAPC